MTTQNSTFQDFIASLFDKPSTDYEKRPKFLVTVFNADGSERADAYADSIDEVSETIKANPDLWGCKVVTYKIHKELTVDVPVSVTKADIEE